MRRFIWILLLLVVSVWLGLQIAKDPGYALFMYQHWMVSMPLWFACLVLALLFLLFYLIMSLVGRIDTSIIRLQNWLRWRHKYKSYNKTTRGLLELIECHWKNAEHILLDGIDKSSMPLLNYLAAAKAAHEQRAYDKRDQYLRKAYEVAPQAKIAIGLTQAQLQFAQGKLEQALATLDHLRQSAPKQEVILKLLQKIYTRLADWRALLALLPALRKAKILSTEQADNLEMHAYQELLQEKMLTQEALRNVWKSMSRKLQKDPAVLAIYVKQLRRYPEMAAECEMLLCDALKKSWNTELVVLYGQLITLNPVKQLAAAEKWLRYYPNQAALFLTLGKIAMRCQLWGKAREYLENSLKLEMQAETFAEYGKLLEQLGEQDAALKHYRDGLMLAMYPKNALQ